MKRHRIYWLCPSMRLHTATKQFSHRLLRIENARVIFNRLICCVYTTASGVSMLYIRLSSNIIPTDHEFPVLWPDCKIFSIISLLLTALHAIWPYCKVTCLCLMLSPDFAYYRIPTYTLSTLLFTPGRDELENQVLKVPAYTTTQIMIDYSLLKSCSVRLAHNV